MGNSQGSVNQGHSTWLIDTREHVHVVLSTVCVCIYNITSSTARGGAGSFKRRSIYINRRNMCL